MVAPLVGKRELVLWSEGREGSREGGGESGIHVERMKRSEELEKAGRELAIEKERYGKGVGLGKPGKFSKERKK